MWSQPKRAQTVARHPTLPQSYSPDLSLRTLFGTEEGGKAMIAFVKETNRRRASSPEMSPTTQDDRGSSAINGIRVPAPTVQLSFTFDYPVLFYVQPLFAPYHLTASVMPVFLMYSRETAACRQTHAVYKLNFK